MEKGILCNVAYEARNECLVFLKNTGEFSFQPSLFLFIVSNFFIEI